jgi:hypothetical protein
MPPTPLFALFYWLYLSSIMAGIVVLVALDARRR